MLIYLHLPKAAGTTLRLIIEREYGLDKIFQINGLHSNEDVMKDLHAWPNFNDIELISGHQYFGIHKYLYKECKYITMMRDPIERVISSYCHIVRPKDRSMETLKDFANHWQGNNLQTKLIAGGDSNLNEAIENIEKYFIFVGVSEMFDQSILLMQQKLSWKTPYYVIENPSHNRMTADSLDDDIINIIKEANQLDMQLYEYAKENIFSQIKESGEIPFYKSLTNFESDNYNNNIEQMFAGPGHSDGQPLADKETLLPISRASTNHKIKYN